MRNNNRKVGVSPRSAIDYAQDYLWVPLDEASGTSIAYSGKLNGTAFSGSLTLGDGTRSANRMAQPAAGNTTGGVITTDATIAAATAMPANGGIIALMCTRFASYVNDSTAEEMAFQWGANSAAGGYHFGLQGGVNLNTRACIWDKAGVGAVAVTSIITALTNQFVTIEAYIKPGNVKVISNGNWGSASQASGGTSFQTETLPSGFGVSILCGHTNTTTKANTINEGANGNRGIGELIIIRDEDGSLEAEMATIAAEHAYYWREKLWSLA